VTVIAEVRERGVLELAPALGLTAASIGGSKDLRGDYFE